MSRPCWPIAHMHLYCSTHTLTLTLTLTQAPCLCFHHMHLRAHYIPKTWDGESQLRFLTWLESIVKIWELRGVGLPHTPSWHQGSAKQASTLSKGLIRGPISKWHHWTIYRKMSLNEGITHTAETCLHGLQRVAEMLENISTFQVGQCSWGTNMAAYCLLSREAFLQTRI